MQGVQKYVASAYVGAGLILWATLAKLFSAIAGAANVPDPALLGQNFTLANLLGLLVAGAAAFFAVKNPKVNEFATEVVVELRKVTWPSRKETKTATVVVIICTIVVSLILGFFDMVWAKMTGIIYNK